MGLAMIAGFIAFLYFGRQPGVALLVFVFQTLIYRELISVALVASKEQDMPGFRLFYYWWFGVFTFYMYTRTLGPPLLDWLTGDAVDAASGGGDRGVPGGAGGIAVRLVVAVVQYHTPLAFAAYMASLVAFVLSLQRQRHFRYQFAQFAYAHMALLAVVVQSTLLVASSLKGLIWFVLPCSLVIANDSFAYIFGFLFGRTPLIRLSPKKTVEGFIGGALATFAMAWLLTYAFTSLRVWHVDQLMVCPATHALGAVINQCDVATAAGGLFAPHPLRSWWIVSWMPEPLASLHITEMQLHATVLAMFASIVAPFGGFFASGFKRSQRIKDFGNAIPGHGGFTDRMDCQLVMGGGREGARVDAPKVLGI